MLARQGWASPSPRVLMVWGMPELEMAIQGVSRGGDPVGGGRAQDPAPLQGDRIEIHNHGAAAAALTMAEIEARRRARLDARM